MIGSSVIGAGASIWGADKAASAQKKSALAAAQLQSDQFDRVYGDLQPFKNFGYSAVNDLRKNLNFFESPIKMDQKTLENTPGYKFTLAQGLKSVQNSAAARGLGTSGAALKGAAGYATGLADQTYLDQFNVENTNRNNAFNRLMAIAGMGQNAAVQTGSFGSTAATNSGNALMSAGNAQAAAFNSMGQSIGNAASSIPTALMWNQYMNKNGGSSPTLWG